MKSKINWSDEELLRTVCASARSVSNALEMLGLSKNGGGNVHTFRKKTQEYGIDISHFMGRGWSKNMKFPARGKTDGPSNDEIFVENSKTTRSVVRKRLIKHKIIPYKCAGCGNTGEWLGNTMSLELDHINGNNKDNRIENLRWLCPNCHATTETYCGRNIKRTHKPVVDIKQKVKIYSCAKCKKPMNSPGKHGLCLACIAAKNRKLPSVEILIKELSNHSYDYVGKKYGVTGAAVRKIMKRSGKFEYRRGK